MDRDTHPDARAHLTSVTGEYPKELEDPTPAQYSVIDALIEEGSVPYVGYNKSGAHFKTVLHATSPSKHWGLGRRARS